MTNPEILTADLAQFVKSWGAEGDFNALALRLFAYQYENNGPYRRFCDARGVRPGTVEEWKQIPAAPAEAFRAQVLSCSAGEPAALFYTSGTTSGAAAGGAEDSRGRGVHRMDRMALELYRLSLTTAFRRLAARAAGLPIRALVAPYTLAPHSSLSYMVSALAGEDRECDPALTFQPPSPKIEALTPQPPLPRTGEGETNNPELNPDATHPGTGHRFFWKDEGPDLEGAWSCLAQDTQPVLVFTTAFALLELLEWKDSPLPLPPGSMVIETGGFKGRSRSVEREELYAMTSERFQIPVEDIGSEYGMCEMASQFYDWNLGKSGVGGESGVDGWMGGWVDGKAEHPTPNTQHPTPGPITVPPALGVRGPAHRTPNAEHRTPNTEHRTPTHPSIHPPIKLAPPWVRTVLIDPVTGLEAAPGAAGLLRHYDLCNFNSVQGITTADLGLPVEGRDGFILQGRLSSAPPRGCSLTIEEWAERRG